VSETSVIPPAGGELIGDAPDRRVEILFEHEAVHATWSRFGPRRDGADPHIHRRHSDFFYVLAGELTVRLGVEDEQVAVPAGTLVRVPPLVVHGFRNGGDAELRYLNLHAPGVGFADYMRGLREGRRVAFDQEDPPADGTRPASEAELVEPRPQGDRVRVLADTEAIAIAEVRSDPGDPPPAPLPPRRVACVYVLEGELTAGDARATAGSWVHAPPEALAFPAPVRYLDIRA
jgi:mannose-6-phosphate isomerase-like protein (cupin superfamily)